MSSRLLLKNSAIYALGDIIPRALSFIVFPILTSYLSLTDYGVISYVNTLILLFTLGGFFCLNTFYLVYYFRIGDQEQQRKLLGSLSIFIIGLNLLLTLLFLAVGYFFPNILSADIEFFPYIAIGIVTNFFNMLTVLPSALYRVQERPMPLTILNVLKGVLTMGLTVLLVVKYEQTAFGVLFATMLVSIVFGIIFLYVNIKNMTWGIDWSLIKMGFRFSLPLLPGALASYLFTMSDRFFIEKYLNLAQLGIYSTAATLALILNIVAYGAYKAFEPYFFQIYGKEGFKERFVKIQNAYMFVILVMSMGLCMYSREFFLFFSSVSYHQVYYYVPMIELGVVFSSMSMLYGTIVIAMDKTSVNSVISILGGVVSVALNVFLLPKIGIVGSCIASATAFGLILILLVYYSKLEMNFTRPILALIITTLTIYLGVYVIEIESIALIVIVKGLIIIVISYILYRVLTLKKIINVLYLSRDKK